MKKGKTPLKRRSLLVRRILRWYKTFARPLPWRKTRNPYEILVSEVMLQQTQVSRVLQKYGPFLKRFPSLSTLARSSPDRVIRAWSGMGYNNRAVRLRSLAGIVVRDCGGRIPKDVGELRKLPGIGKYTAHAIACFAYEQPVPVVDTNISRVLGRVFRGTELDAWDLAGRILPSRSAYEWNQSLMELGATICTSARPRCVDCPISGLCPSAFQSVHRMRSLRKKEPGRNGVPNRIYRGRIVETLRKQRRGRAGLALIGRKIKADFSGTDRTWLLKLLGRLEQDGLIRKSGSGKGISVRLAS